MKLLSAIAILLLSLTVATKAETSSTSGKHLSLFDLHIGMNSEKMIELLKVSEESKVQVGNRNNHLPIDVEKVKQKIGEKYKTLYSNAPIEALQKLINQVASFENGNHNYEVSCSNRKNCDTSFFRDNNISYFIARFSNYNELGNFSIHQNLLGYHNPADIIKELFKKHGKEKVFGDFERSTRRSISYETDDGARLTIKIITSDSHTNIEYNLISLDVFKRAVEFVTNLEKEFEASLE